MQGNIFIALLFLSLIANGLWYYIKDVVRQNGYETHLFWGHWTDIVNLHRLVTREQDALKKEQFKLLLFIFYAVIFLFIGSFLLLVLLG